MPKQRPDPDQLLAEFKAEEVRAARGRLKIFFGASAGVGKTYAMLAAAQTLRRTGTDVVVGFVETHGRAETSALVEGLEQLPPLLLDVKGASVKEFNLDAALARHPALILVDELAHTNAPGARHPKRWQDVDELLAAGVDVFTTLNVQHLESLNDVVGGITGIRVWETVPDTFFDEADEVVLVDIPADELLARLKAGKVYIPEQIERAAGNFFRKGNLMALRELALRRTADRVEDDVQAYRTDEAIERVWKTEASLLCCVGPSPGGEHVVRSAARLAIQLDIEWTAVYVETPALQRLPPSERERILKTVKLAQDLGAKTAILSSGDAASAVVEYARTHNCSKVVLGRAPTGRRWPWASGIAKRVGKLAPDVDVIEMGRGEAKPATPATQAVSEDTTEPSSRMRKRLAYVWTLLACVATALIATPLMPYFDLANIVMLFLMTVVLVAVKFGRGPAVAAALISVASFDFFFVPPRFSFAVTDLQYLLTFVVMLAVGLITGQMTAGLRYQARIASYREQRARALYEFARDMSSLLQTEQVVEAATKFIESTFQARVAILIPDEQERLQLPGGGAAALDIDVRAAAQWAYDKSQPAGAGTDTLPGSEFLYVPLRAPMRTRGVLAIRASNRRLLMIPEQRRHLDTFAALVAIALERVHYVDVAQKALISMESERLRNSLLAALSHDLRTPLASLVGLAEWLELAKPELAGEQRETIRAIAEQARRMSALVNNLLDMARIQSGEVKLRREWQSVEEVVGSALKAAQPALANHRVEVALPRDLPLVEFDATLIERVLYNLLENAGKYTPAGTTIGIDAAASEGRLLVTVSDNGPGISEGQREAVFEKFTRGSRESATPGVGLGLAISRAIVEAHRGRIWVEDNPGGGARFRFTLPLGTPPAPMVETTTATGAT
ncbi:MAG TPA: two-component system sensor histidine kinase KdpD [Casimicrobiaceae bacterium]|nr:two-component system sensor histidine kinase KdpD [Casimicrobiaceae bacterium]